MSVLEVKNIVKEFGDTRAVDDISFEVDQGQIFGMLGPNGAGKTTTIRMINNILVPDEGEIHLFGEKVNEKHQNLIGYLPEERGLYKKIKVIDQLIYFAQLKGMNKKEARNKAYKWLDKLGAKDWADKKIQELSKGMSQKVQFISTILHEPKFLILDEPFSGFDPINVEMLKNILINMKNEGKTIILSTHVMHQVEQMCDDIILINKGKNVLNGRIRQIKSNFGKDTAIMEFEGNPDYFETFDGIKILNKSLNRIEFRITDEDLDSKAILQKTLNEGISIIKFEMVEPSINEIFIEVVSEKEASDD